MKVSGRLSNSDFSSLREEPVLVKGKPVPRVWYLVADGQNALVFRKVESDLEQIADITPTDEFVPSPAEKTGGHITTAGGARRSAYYTSNPMDREGDHDEKVFLKNVSGWIEKAANDDVFDELVVAAAPEALGLLRECLNGHVRQKIVQEINKDYVNTPLAELEAALIKQTPPQQLE